MYIFEDQNKYALLYCINWSRNLLIIFLKFCDRTPITLKDNLNELFED
jgi:hypothetical protein